MTDRDTINVYDAKADEYDQLDTSDTPSETLAVFMSGLPKAGRVLDLGCGPGTSSRHMARAGLRVEAWDASQEMVARAAAIEGVAALQASFHDLTAQHSYDGIWANFSLLHAPKSELPAHLSAIHKALKPKGLFHIALKEGAGEKRDRLGRFYSYYSVDEMVKLLQSHGFETGPVSRGQDVGLDGSMAPWFSLTAHA